MQTIATTTAAALIPPRLQPQAGAASSAYAGYQIIRRNGAVVPFAPDKIAIAMMKAFLAVHGTQGAASASVREVVDELTHSTIVVAMWVGQQHGLDDITADMMLEQLMNGIVTPARATSAIDDEPACAGQPDDDRLAVARADHDDVEMLALKHEIENIAGLAHGRNSSRRSQTRCWSRSPRVVNERGSSQMRDQPRKASSTWTWTCRR